METTPKETFPSFPTRVLQVFFSPGVLFESLRERPKWFGVLTLGAALVAVSLLLIPGEIWLESAREQILSRGGEVPPGLASAGVLLRVTSVLGGVIFWYLWAFVLAGIVTLVFSFLFGDEGRYVQYLSVVSHGLLVGAVGALLLTPLRILQEDPSLTLNIGTFTVFLREGYFFRVLKLLDLFGLWGYAVMAVGVTKVDPRRGLGSSFAFFAAFAVVFALVFGLFGG